MFSSVLSVSFALLISAAIIGNLNSVETDNKSSEILSNSRENSSVLDVSGESRDDEERSDPDVNIPETSGEDNQNENSSGEPSQTEDEEPSQTENGSDENSSGEPSQTEDEENEVINEFEHQFGKPLNLFVESNLLNVNDQVLNDIFLHPNVKDRKIVVLSIVGAFRNGKSFFLDYCLRFLYRNYKSINYPDNPLNGTDDWMGNEDDPLIGFPWRSGSIRETAGVQIWSDVFLYTDNRTGKELAIVLMDSQGIFDAQTTSAELTKIFSLTTLMSSIQIFNLNEAIEEEQLQFLQLTTEVANYISYGDENDGKVSQRLMFLIRDWTNNDFYDFGLNGGTDYIADTLGNSSKTNPELQLVRENIYNSFESISCYLLPSPGTVVSRGFTKDFQRYDGRYFFMSNKFVEGMKESIGLMLSPSNLEVKRINGHEMNGEKFFEFIVGFLNSLQIGNLPRENSLFDLKIDEYLSLFSKEIADKYRIQMRQNVNLEDKNVATKIAESDLKNRAVALRTFNEEISKLGPAALQGNYIERLISTLDDSKDLLFTDAEVIFYQKESLKFVLETKNDLEKITKELNELVNRLTSCSSNQTPSYDVSTEKPNIVDNTFEKPIIKPTEQIPFFESSTHRHDSTTDSTSTTVSSSTSTTTAESTTASAEDTTTSTTEAESVITAEPETTIKLEERAESLAVMIATMLSANGHFDAKKFLDLRETNHSVNFQNGEGPFGLLKGFIEITTKEGLLTNEETFSVIGGKITDLVTKQIPTLDSSEPPLELFQGMMHLLQEKKVGEEDQIYDSVVKNGTQDLMAKLPKGKEVESKTVKQMILAIADSEDMDPDSLYDVVESIGRKYTIEQATEKYEKDLNKKLNSNVNDNFNNLNNVELNLRRKALESLDDLKDKMSLEDFQNMKQTLEDQLKVTFKKVQHKIAGDQDDSKNQLEMIKVAKKIEENKKIILQSLDNNNQQHKKILDEQLKEALKIVGSNISNNQEVIEMQNELNLITEKLKNDKQLIENISDKAFENQIKMLEKQLEETFSTIEENVAKNKETIVNQRNLMQVTNKIKEANLEKNSKSDLRQNLLNEKIDEKINKIKKNVDDSKNAIDQQEQFIKVLNKFSENQDTVETDPGAQRKALEVQLNEMLKNVQNKIARDLEAIEMQKDLIKMAKEIEEKRDFNIFTNKNENLKINKKSSIRDWRIKPKTIVKERKREVVNFL